MVQFVHPRQMGTFSLEATVEIWNLEAYRDLDWAWQTAWHQCMSFVFCGFLTFLNKLGCLAERCFAVKLQKCLVDYEKSSPNFSISIGVSEFCFSKPPNVSVHKIVPIYLTDKAVLFCRQNSQFWTGHCRHDASSATFLICIGVVLFWCCFKVVCIHYNNITTLSYIICVFCLISDSESPGQRRGGANLLVITCFPSCTCLPLTLPPTSLVILLIKKTEHL